MSISYRVPRLLVLRRLVRLLFVRLLLRLPPLTNAAFDPYSYAAGTYTPAPPCPTFFDKILVSSSKNAIIL